MRIAIIGGNLARRLTALGYQVTIANSRGPQTLGQLADETGARAVPIGEVAAGAALVVVAVPEGRVPDLPDDVLAGAAADVVVIDTGNYYPQRDGRLSGIEDDGVTESRWVERQLSHPVVKGFDNVYAANLIEAARPADVTDRMAVPIAADDPAAKQIVSDLVDQLGFDPVDAGGLDDSWRQQPGTPAYGVTADVAGMRRLLDQASPERTAQWRG
ncbi:MAG: NAD(P)-binding domain-containing protein [Actinomycetota bacterium]|nr:NAD(P)-binding domain-containing protein [Actinomycetota bacterium]